MRYISKLKNNPVKQEDNNPSVSLVISVFNEENVLGRKLENALDLDYPQDLLEIAVISDGSSDGTNGIIIEYEKGNDLIRPFIFSSFGRWLSPARSGVAIAAVVADCRKDRLESCFLFLFMICHQIFHRYLLPVIHCPFPDL